MMVYYKAFWSPSLAATLPPSCQEDASKQITRRTLPRKEKLLAAGLGANFFLFYFTALTCGKLLLFSEDKCSDLELPCTLFADALYCEYFIKEIFFFSIRSFNEHFVQLFSHQISIKT